ncbi:MAG TPA: thaumatin family protein, partial [Polyangiaceae bacterium]|nr:thaumatin family protein [Polyangiaceae bacterium]
VGAVTTGGTSPTGDLTTGAGSVATGGKSAATSGNAATAGSANASTDCRKEGDNKTTLVFVNYCTQTVTYRGSDIAGGTVAPGASVCVDIGNATDAISSKRYWGYVGTDPGAEHHSLAEFTFNTDFYDMDWYNISYVDAFNLPLAILPMARPKCRQLICPQDYLGACPAEGQYRDISGAVVSCVSPNRDDPNGPVVQLFEQCNDAYAWSGDDQTGSDPSPMIGCEVEDFEIVFCPKG